MNAPVGLEQCLSFINCHIKPPEQPIPYREPARKCAITISRQSGCGAHALAYNLAERLQQENPSDRQWTVFDRNLMERVLADHHLPERLARFLPEDRSRHIDDILDELFGVHPASWTSVQQTAETILNLAELGNVIILGRGANVITVRMAHVLHLRLVGSLERRIERLQEREGIDPKTSAERIRREDQGRARYFKQHFDRQIDDPLLYHAVINVDLVSENEIVDLICGLVQTRLAAPVKPSCARPEPKPETLGRLDQKFAE